LGHPGFFCFFQASPTLFQKSCIGLAGFEKNHFKLLAKALLNAFFYEKTINGVYCCKNCEGICLPFGKMVFPLRIEAL
jgi:hypothetical protein